MTAFRAISYSGTGTPNGFVVGNVGDLYTDTTGGVGATLWVKETGNGTNTGWSLSSTGSISILSLLANTRIQYWSGNLGAVSGYYAGLNCGIVVGSANVVQQGATTILNSSSRGYGFSSSAGPLFLGSYDDAAGSASNPTGFVLRGNAVGIGGFTNITRFAIEQVSATPTLWCFVGLSDTWAHSGMPPSNIDWTTQTALNAIGIGFSQTVAGGVLSGNWQIISCNAAAVTVTDSGFAAVANHLIESTLVAAPDDNKITWTIRDLTAGTSATGTVNSTLPVNTQALAWHAGMTVHSGGAASNVFSTVRYIMQSNN